MSDVLVIGGTGAMGGRIVLRLLETTSDAVHVLTRDPDSPRARGLLGLGGGRVRMVRGDVDDVAGVRTAMGSTDRVFCNTDFFSTGAVTGEYEQGVALLEAARVAGVDRFIWSSLDFAAHLTGGALPVPHYDSKGAVASYIGLRRSDEMMREEVDGWYTHHVSVLTTAPYFTHTFDHWHDGDSHDLAIAADALTGPEIADAFERVTGTPAAYVPVPLDAFRTAIPDFGHDFAAMFEFFQTRDLVALDRDLPALRDLHPGLRSFEDWLRATGWDGSEQDVQRFPARRDGTTPTDRTEVVG